MEPNLTGLFGEYNVYAQKACAEWEKQDSRAIGASPVFPRYSKLDHTLNTLRATTGKYVLKSALKLRGGPVAQDGSAVPRYASASRSLGKFFSGVGMHEWNQVFLPHYSPAQRLDTNFFFGFARMFDAALSGFEAWRTRTHPDCSIKETEQASRLVWFALYWAVIQGRIELSPGDLEAIWNYAMLYPYIDNFLDSKGPEHRAYRDAFVLDLRRSIAANDTPAKAA